MEGETLSFRIDESSLNVRVRHVMVWKGEYGKRFETVIFFGMGECYGGTMARQEYHSVRSSLSLSVFLLAAFWIEGH